MEMNVIPFKLELAITLAKLYKFKKAESILISLLEKASKEPDIDLCSALGNLYLAWEKFAKCEHWLQQGLSQRHKDPLALLITFAQLCLKSRIDWMSQELPLHLSQ